MSNNRFPGLDDFLEVLGLSEEPLAMFYSDQEPQNGFAPKPAKLPTVKEEAREEVDWENTFQNFSCVLGKIWLARRKKAAAYFSAERFGCLGGAFFLGYNKPQLDFVINFVSSGIPGVREGELYFDSPEGLKAVFEDMDPPSAPKTYTVFKPLSILEDNEEPLLIIFFARPEQLSGLHQLATFINQDPEAVMSPWAAGCGNLVAWPRIYLDEGRPKAVLGTWDPSCRKYVGVDELSFTMPLDLFEEMLEGWPDSFLTTPTWSGIRKRIARSKKMWGDK